MLDQLIKEVLNTQNQVIKEGFKWQTALDVTDKLQEELQELQEVIEANDPRLIEEEFGDLCLALISLSVYLKVDFNTCLSQSLEKFKMRYQSMKKRADNLGSKFSNLSLEQKIELWQKIK